MSIQYRHPEPGDLDWIIERHAELYGQEQGWGAGFTRLVRDIVDDFAREHDPARERCWIALDGNERVGCVFLVRHRERPGVARLRLLLVEPSARGSGLGAALVRECTDFARATGYHTITLWTNSVLHSARRIYEAEGYRLVAEQAHSMFGEGLVGQTWDLQVRSEKGGER